MTVPQLRDSEDDLVLLKQKVLLYLKCRTIFLGLCMIVCITDKKKFEPVFRNSFGYISIYTYGAKMFDRISISPARYGV